MTKCLNKLCVKNTAIRTRMYYAYGQTNSTYPAALFDDPGSHALLKILHSVLFHARRSMSTQACQVHGSLCESEHHGDLLPARVRTELFTEDLLEVAVADAVHEITHQR